MPHVLTLSRTVLQDVAQLITLCSILQNCLQSINRELVTIWEWSEVILLHLEEIKLRSAETGEKIYLDAF